MLDNKNLSDEKNASNRIDRKYRQNKYNERTVFTANRQIFGEIIC